MNLKRAAALSLLHFFVLAMSFVVSFSFVMERFDDGGPITIREQIASTLTNVLSFPARLLWQQWASPDIPNIVEWLVVGANSVLWGLVVSYAWGRLRPRRTG
jgi:hypothetical protein